MKNLAINKIGLQSYIQVAQKAPATPNEELPRLTSLTIKIKRDTKARRVTFMYACDFSLVLKNFLPEKLYYGVEQQEITFLPIKMEHQARDIKGKRVMSKWKNNELI